MLLAVCQMTSGQDVDANLACARGLVRDAAKQGGQLICLPEYFLFYGDEQEYVAVAGEKTPGAVELLSADAARLGVWLSIGSVLEPTDVPGKVANTSLLIDPTGRTVERYVKRHLFDVNLPDRRYCESDFLVPGQAVVTAEVDDWTVGMSICFDLRFAGHYAELARRGAGLLLVPSAFTAVTGQVHWAPLLRARAIETQCFVAAAAQVGQCGAGKVCHGHSMIVDPWGEVLAELPDGVGVIVATLDKDVLRHVRQSMPMCRLDSELAG